MKTPKRDTSEDAQEADMLRQVSCELRDALAQSHRDHASALRILNETTRQLRLSLEVLEQRRETSAGQLERQAQWIKDNNSPSGRLRWDDKRGHHEREEWWDNPPMPWKLS